MSLWIYKKDKNGKPVIWVVQVAIPFLIMFLAALLAVLIGPRLHENPSIILSMPFVFSGVGFILVLISKTSLFRRGIRFSLGPSQMTKNYAAIYKAGYFLIALGVLIQLLLLKKLWRA